ncbi:peptidoglycan-binding protein, partial [Streptomyces sp. SID14478]|uniref:peptidoglycan-binding domain-containing protein n=1 Tax=Streptomyces sp. SID14478 TaxID=2706073 RepID=UPI0013D93D73
PASTPPPSSSAPPATRTPSPDASRTTAAPSRTAPPATRHSPSHDGGALHRGDRGPEVSELQYRLRKLNLYADEPDGDFDDRTVLAVATYQFARGIDGDATGTYGPATRRALEAETG